MPPPHQTDLKLKEYDFAIVQLQISCICVSQVHAMTLLRLYILYTHTHSLYRGLYRATSQLTTQATGMRVCR